MEELVGILVPLGFFAMITAIVVLPRYFRSQERQKMAETVRLAIEKGQPLPKEFTDALTGGEVRATAIPSAQRDLRRGVIWLGVGIGLAAIGVVVGFSEPDSTYHFIGVAALPVFIGLAFVVLSVLNKPKS